MDEEVVPLWNISDIMDDSLKAKLVNKTNNALECYNHHFNSLFGSDHSQLVAFVIIVHNETDRIVQRMEDVDKGRDQPPEYLEPVFPKIHDEFWDKVGVKKAKGKTGGRGREGIRHNCGVAFFVWGLIVCLLFLSLILGVTSTNFKSGNIECY
jgi:hypothetical protein